MNDVSASKLLVDGHGEYPRPQLRREAWTSLDGRWGFAFDPQAKWRLPAHVEWTQEITVPFSPETRASGIGDTGFYSAVWYRRLIPMPELKPGERLILHFGAVDYEATVWFNGRAVYIHEGGYTGFSVDLTDTLLDGGEQEIVVRAFDDPEDLAKPRGKQDWKLDSHSIWYPRTTGIWQTVWTEIVPSMSIRKVNWSSNMERWEIGMEVQVSGRVPPGSRLAVRMSTPEQTLADDSYSIVAGEVSRRIALADPGIDDFRNTLLWSPDSPTLIDVQMDLLDGENNVIDSVTSYTALRSITVQGNRFILNGRPQTLRLVLDQGYWPESGLTAPDGHAFLRDILLVKSMGFNGVRKHQKIEDPRFLFWADHLGLMVWEEMPSAYRYTRKSIRRVTSQWAEVIARDMSHPCIVTWVPFNESWGVPDLPESAAQRHYVQALYHLTKTLDPQRPVIGNDGWESVATDIVGIHDYDSDPKRIARRYGVDEIEARLLRNERPGGRLLTLGEGVSVGQPIVLTEFGGISVAAKDGKEWGYTNSRTPEDFLVQYAELLQAIRSLPGLAGFCYTQFTDTYQEANGLLYADRTPKVPTQQIALATMGGRMEQEDRFELLWRQVLMERQRGAQ